MNVVVETHSGLRWLLLVGLIALVLIGLARWKKESGHPPYLVTVTSVLLDVQVLIGIILLFANGHWGEQFFGIVHPLLMLAAAGLFKIGKNRVQRDPQPAQGRKLTVVTVVTLGLILGAIPW